MCIAIYKPAGEIIEEKTFRQCFGNNDDGAGFAVVEPDENGVLELNIHKGIFSIERFLKEFEPYKDKQALIHFRIATHKTVNGINCHPWRVNDNLVFIHNGTIANINKNEAISDTGNFANEILAPLAKAAPDFWKSPQFKWFIENSIGSNNKLVLMDLKGDVAIFNEKAGEWDGKVWYSNTSYRLKRQGWTCYGGNMLNDEYAGDFAEVQSGTSSITRQTTTSSPTTTTKIDETEMQALDLDEVDNLLEQFQNEAATAKK